MGPTGVTRHCASARAAKPSAGVIASRVIGEIFISIGVLMLLFVVYSLWWTNVRAHQEADGATHTRMEFGTPEDAWLGISSALGAGRAEPLR